MRQQWHIHDGYPNFPWIEMSMQDGPYASPEVQVDSFSSEGDHFYEPTN